jgi:dTDP-glucose 4,6-dehydratase
MLFLSSGAIYGRQPAAMSGVDEDYLGGHDLYSPAAAYAEAKRAGELLCAMESRRGNLDVTIARCFAFVGPHLPLDRHFAIGNFISDALSHREIVVQGDGTATRSYLYAPEMALWLLTILLEGRSLRPYDVGSDEPVTVAELAKKVAETESPTLPIRVLGAPVPESARDRYVPCVRRIKSELGLSQKVDLDTAIARTKRWYAGKIRESADKW